MKKISKLLGLLIFLLIAAAPIYSIVTSEEIPAAQKSLEERLKDSVVLYVGSSQALVNNKETQVDSSNPKVKPFIKESRTLVPVRFITEALGAEVEWDASSSTVTILFGNRELKLVIGSKIMIADKEEVPLEVAPEIVEGRTFLPLRSIAEALGKKVFYDRGLIVISEKEYIFDITSEKEIIDEVIAKVNNLPVVGSLEALEELIKNSRANGYGLYYKIDEMFVATVRQSSMKLRRFSDSEGAVENAIAYDNDGINQQIDYSTTNIQVQGVDEADVVKTDGQYIYQVNNGRIIVAKAYPADKMDIMDIVDFSDEDFTPQEIYLYGDLLVTIGNSYERTSDRKEIESQAENKMRIKAYRRKNSVKAIVCDISDKTNIKKIREVEIEGNYVSSRMIGSVLYMISNNYNKIYYTYDGDMEIQTPFYRDSKVSDEYIRVECPDIRYFPDSVEANYMLVAAFDIKEDKKANIQTYLGSGENIYVSKDNLYVAVTNYNYEETSRKRIMNSQTQIISFAPVYKDNSVTEVYKFSLNGSKMTYLGKGSVPGVILNQFSMDEHNGYFRIATTTNSMGFNRNVSGNNLYILDDIMNICGKIEDIAKGEEIYSVRFMGDRGYMVTFKTVDPLFVIDLKDPTKPEILGALKIPGYSDYLHPYDENHIIGFGKDTIEVSGGAFYMGMKIALFDVSDVNNPVQKFSEVIGDRGTDSELLENHKALLFSKEKNLLAFPVTVAEIKDKDNTINEWGVPQYGEFVFQGAYVYNIDLDNGFTLKGKITHISDKEYLKSGIYDFYSPKTIERIIYINDTLYTLSKGMYKANRLSDLSEIGTLEIPQN